MILIGLLPGHEGQQANAREERWGPRPRRGADRVPERVVHLW